MSAPSLTALRRVNGQAAPPPELPAELWAKIVVAVRMDDPCAELFKFCNMKKDLAFWCRDGTLYEAANRQLGWYGHFEGLKAVQAAWAKVSEKGDFPLWVPPPTAQLYFQQVCKALRRVQENIARRDSVDWIAHPNFTQRPYFPVVAGRVVNSHPKVLLKVPPDTLGYSGLALVAVERDYQIFGEIPKTLWNYGEVFKVALRGPEVARGQMLSHVPHDRDDYPQLAKLAVQKNGRAIRYVPVARRDFFELATLAVQQDGEALFYIDSAYARYGELAMLAVTRTPYVLNGIASTRADYSELAMAAVGRDGLMLRHIDSATPNYVAICRAAVAASGRALRHVRRPSDVDHSSNVDEDTFYEMAQVAMKQNGEALNDLDNMDDDQKNPFDHEKYTKLAVLAILQTPSAIKSIRHSPKKKYDEIVREALMEGAAPNTISFVRPFLTNDYQDVAESAVRMNPKAIEYLDKNDPRYWPIIETVLHEYADTLEYVPQDNKAVYNRLALIAVDDETNDPHALRFVPADVEGINYYEIAKRAIQNDGKAIQHVPPDFHMYEDLAEIAVNQSKYALGYIPKDHKCYQKMVQLQAERMAPPSPEHNYD